MKKIFYLLLIGIMFLIPKSVFATSIKSEPVWKNIWSYPSTANYSSRSTNSFDGVDYYVYSFGNVSNINKYEFFNGAIYNFDSSISYEVKGSVGFYSKGTLEQTKIPPLSNVKIFSKSDTSSYVEFSCTFNNITANGTNPIYYNFTCKDVKLYETSYIDLMFDLTSGPYSSQVYLSRQLEFIPNSSDIKNNEMIEEQKKTNEKLDEANKNLDEINETQKETNEKLDGINDTMNDSNVDMDGANSFFGDFSDTDHGGISGVVTAPLRFINKLTGTCSPISLGVLGANVELPCGDTLFWNKPEVANFRVIWNVLLGGPILYLLLSKLFKVIEGLKNPDDSRIEVMKL